ncbi:MAG: hypothetical protein ACKVJ0_02045 [Nitrosopumilus sp.]|jgi:hypothetical protein|nr:MAG: hypothetical protein ABR53_07640 [Nitrosopumilus sp. BACL13 MAG-121220-bin23]KRO32009.1 MAG: hypothetical protein ABR52_03280 [Nitrosopumilus sp. BACL13 MAG-120910-bin56]MBC8501926.1 hypothetical protein [Nitrosopumilus sp.]MDC4228517.1 hypothetical protein [Nitrosopumilus sp.]MDC4229970.1 hypothetical protein [Nitrosopumilus sp.]|tara:strand:+ start:240 stop:503 length:264 start_codon:yes stop_codon:yes gene_type:complete
MDDLLLQKIEQKIQDSISNQDDIKELIKLLSTIDSSKSFALGIVVGRLYNTFFYQTKRILKRDPTKKEFEDFLKFVENKKPDLEHLW